MKSNIDCSGGEKKNTLEENYFKESIFFFKNFKSAFYNLLNNLVGNKLKEKII